MPVRGSPSRRSRSWDRSPAGSGGPRRAASRCSRPRRRRTRAQVGEHVVDGPGIRRGGGAQLRREQVGGQRGDTRRRGGQQIRYLRAGERFGGHATPPVAQTARGALACQPFTFGRARPASTVHGPLRALARALRDVAALTSSAWRRLPRGDERWRARSTMLLVRFRPCCTDQPRTAAHGEHRCALGHAVTFGERSRHAGGVPCAG